jgi:flagellar M-ring protein FliF
LQDKLSLLWNYIKQLGPVKIATTLVAILAFLILSVIYLYKISPSDMVVLYSELDNSDSNKIVAELEGRGVPYSVESGGATVKVPEYYLLKTRVEMAQLGLPHHGSMVGYEIFDKEETLGTTNFLQNVKMVRALEGEITRTIMTFDAISKARVHLVIPQREVFSKDKQEPRASVILKFKRGQNLSKNEVNALSHLVLTAVPGLSSKNITIVDTAGRTLKLGGEDPDEMSSLNAGDAKADEYRIAFENKMKRVIEELLERSLGAGKVRAQVSAEINFDRVVTNQELYDPDSAVIRSIQTIEDRERTPVGGEDNLDISLANNLPGAGDSNIGDLLYNQAATSEHTDETKNYEISKTIRSEISEAGVVQKLSVAVLVDGRYKKNPETGDLDYNPRSQDELKQIEKLVKAAVGFKDERKDQIEVINMPFVNDILSVDSEDNWLRDQLPSLLQSLVLVVVVGLVFVTIIRPIALRLFDGMRNTKELDVGSEPESRFGEITAEQIEASIVEQKQQTASLKKVNEVMGTHPEEALMVLRKWLNNG